MWRRAARASTSHSSRHSSAQLLALFRSASLPRDRACTYIAHVFQPGAVRFGGREVCCGAQAVEVHWGSFPRLRDHFRFVGRLELSRRDALSYLRCLALPDRRLLCPQNALASSR